MSVKLVSHAGVGTIAAGVAKAYADLITISGYDGGTGASPLTSIKLRRRAVGTGPEPKRARRCASTTCATRCCLQTDGGLKTGLDVVKAAMLGADSFGFGTAPMIALGCKYLRICHLNNCATGVATQDDACAQPLQGHLPEKVMNYFRFVAEETCANHGPARRCVRWRIWSAAPTCWNIAAGAREARRHRPVAACCSATRRMPAAPIADRRATPPDGAGRALDTGARPAIEPRQRRRVSLRLIKQHRPQHRRAPVRRASPAARRHRHGHDARSPCACAAAPGRASGPSTPAACSCTWKAKPTTTSARAWPAAASSAPAAAAASLRSTHRLSATPACTAPPAASCSPRAGRRALRGAQLRRHRGDRRAPATTAANT
jgi:hypothetical protein